MRYETVIDAVLEIMLELIDFLASMCSVRSFAKLWFPWIMLDESRFALPKKFRLQHGKDFPVKVLIKSLIVT